MTWDQILDHPFVKGKITILEEDLTDSPFTHPLTSSQNLEKERQTKQIMCFAGAAGTSHFRKRNVDRKQYLDEPDSSRDSIHAILQSDLENFETDNDNDEQKVPERMNKLTGQHIEQTDDVCYVTGNYNLIVNRLNDNLQFFSNTTSDSVKRSLSQSKERKHKNRDLEKRKLSQNLDNFSLRLGKSSTNDGMEANDKLDQTRYGMKPLIFSMLSCSAFFTSVRHSDKHQANKITTPPLMLPGWDSCIDEYQSPPIENEEWLAFLHRYMQEILDGEIDSLKQQNLVCELAIEVDGSWRPKM